MQLFALFNILDISLAEKKLVSVLCELSCRGVCIADRARLECGWQRACWRGGEVC